MKVRILSARDPDTARAELQRVGVDPEALPILGAKFETLALRIGPLSVAACNIFKQSALAVGADCAVHRDVITGRRDRSELLLLATARQIEKVLEKVSHQPRPMSEPVELVRQALSNYARRGLELVLGGKILDLSRRTHIMGVVNITPDSFSDGGRYLTPAAAVEQGKCLVEEGADILDLGAESSRPGADPVSGEEELRRLLPVLEGLVGRVGVPISVDTYKSKVATAALAAGACMVNDISGLRFDAAMAGTIAACNAACVVMHIKGTPKDMQQNPAYDDLMTEVVDFLSESLVLAQRAGVNAERTVVDPGIGFGKRLEDNYELIRRLGELRCLGRPILVGPSRKSFIGQTLNLPVEDRLEGSLAAAVLAAAHGAHILRVHDVRATRRALAMTDAILGSS